MAFHKIEGRPQSEDEVTWTCSCGESGRFHAPGWNVDRLSAPWMQHAAGDIPNVSVIYPVT